MKDARPSLVLALSAGLYGVAFDRPLSLGLLAVACALPLLRTPGRATSAYLLAAALLGWGTVLGQAVFYADLPRVPWFRVGPITVWREGVSWGLVQALRLLAPMTAGFALARTTTSAELHAALRRFRVPGVLGLFAVLALQAVPDIAHAWAQVRAARARRGRPAWRRSPSAWLQLELSMLRPVVADALRRARDLAEALDARGFDPSLDRPIEAVRPAPLRWLLASAVGAGALAAIGLRVLFALYTADVWYAPGLRGVYGFVRAWL